MFLFFYIVNVFASVRKTTFIDLSYAVKYAFVAVCGDYRFFAFRGSDSFAHGSIMRECPTKCRVSRRAAGVAADRKKSDSLLPIAVTKLQGASRAVGR